MLILLEVRCRTPLPIIVTSQSFAKPNPTVQRMTSNYKNWLAWASDNLLFIFLILILVLDSSSWCTYGGFRTWGGEQGGLKSPRSRPKVLSPDNLAIFVAQLVGKTSSIPPHQPPHPPPYGTRETGPRANTSKGNDEQQYYIISLNYDKQ